MNVYMAWIDVSMVVPSSVRNSLNIAHSLRKESIPPLQGLDFFFVIQGLDFFTYFYKNFGL